MPKAQWELEPLTAADDAIFKKLQESCSGYGKQVRLHLAYLETFMRLNPTLRGRPATEVYGRLASQWLRHQRAMSSVLTMISNFERFHADPDDIAPALERVRLYEIRSGIQRFALTEGKKKPRVLLRHPLDGVPTNEPTARDQQEKLSLWCLLCVTGARAANVLKIRTMKVLDDGLKITWGERKCRGGITVEYHFSWSSAPPTWVRQRWVQLKEKPWPYNSKTVASNINRWVKRWFGPSSGITSTSPRETIDSVLRAQVKEGKLNEAEYERVIDHSYGTGLDYYTDGVQQELVE